MNYEKHEMTNYEKNGLSNVKTQFFEICGLLMYHRFVVHNRVLHHIQYANREFQLVSASILITMVGKK